MFIPRTQMNTQDKEREAMHRVVQQFERNHHNLVKERDALKSDFLQQQKLAEEFRQTVQETQYEIRSLKDSLLLLEKKNRKLKDEINESAAEKNKKLDEIQNLLDKMDGLQSKV